MKFTRNNIAETWKVLSDFKGAYNKKFSMYLVLNQKRLKPFIEEIIEIQKLVAPNDRIRELQQQELDIINKYVERDEGNKPIIYNGQSFKLSPENKVKYEEEILKFREENKDTIDEVTSNKVEFERLMNEEVDIELIQFPFDCIPDQIDVETLEKMSDIIKDFDNIVE